MGECHLHTVEVDSSNLSSPMAGIRRAGVRRPVFFFVCLTVSPLAHIIPKADRLMGAGPQGGVMRIFILVGLLLAGATAFSQEGGRLSTIAILDLGDRGGGGQVVSLLPGVIAKQLSSYGLFEVLSRDEIRKMLSHEQDKMLAGCDDASCLAEIGGALGVEALVAGDVGKVGEKYLINLQRIDIRNAKVVKRVERQFEGSPSKLLDEMRLAAHQVVEDVLKSASGQLLFSVSEEGADISVDGGVVGTSPMKRIELPAGPHDVRVAKKGFVAWARTVKVKPHGTEMVEVTMIPSAAFIEGYEDEAVGMRRWAWISAAAAVALEGAALGLRIFTWQKYDPIVDDYNNEVYLQQGLSQEEYYDRHKDDIELADKLDYAALGLGITGAVVCAVSLYLFIEGEDPDRYERFHGVTEGSSAGLLPDSGGFQPVPGGGTVTIGWGF